MNIDELKRIIEDNYGLVIVELEKVKNVYRIKTNTDHYCLKIIKYNFPHFLFILSAIKHLQNKSFDRVPEILKRKDGGDYIQIENSYAYLTMWINARECNYDNPLDVMKAAIKLAELHNLSEGFKVTEEMQPRVYWYKWVEHFRARKNEIIDFRSRILKKDKNSEFDYLYLKSMEEELARADMAVENLLNSKYSARIGKDIGKGGFCHHDYAHHNVLIEENGKVNIIDFDYCILDTGLHDLGSLLLRKMKNGNWDLKDTLYIINSYNSVREVAKEDIPILAAFMEFPQDYWQVGIQYYWEQQPWGEDFFIRKLKKIYEDKDEKQEFIDEFREINYQQ